MDCLSGYNSRRKYASLITSHYICRLHRWRFVAAVLTTTVAMMMIMVVMFYSQNKYKLPDEEKMRHFRNTYLSTGQCRIAMISTFPPKQCGIAQFSKNFYNSFSELEFHNCTMHVIALLDSHDSHLSYNISQVAYLLQMDSELPSRAFWDAAIYINSHQYSHVIIQQEFGITPIQWQLIDLARWISPEISITTVIHTPTAYPTIEERELVRQFSRTSRHMVFMSWHGYYSAIHSYGLVKEKCVFIPHGVSKIPAEPPQSILRLLGSSVSGTVEKQRHNSERKSYSTALSGNMSPALVSLLSSLQGRLVILSNGLIHRHKGYHRIISALPFLISIYPQLVFLVIGREHSQNKEKNIMPNLLKDALALGIAEHVLWHNAYVNIEELDELLRITDIFVTPFDEITPTSGTLLMAMSKGLAIAATPFRFAVEVLSDDRGLFIPFDDIQMTVIQLKKLLGSESLRQRLGEAAQRFVLSWTWDQVAQQYLDLISNQGSFSMPNYDRRGSYYPQRTLTPDPFEKELAYAALDGGLVAKGLTPLGMLDYGSLGGYNKKNMNEAMKQSIPEAYWTNKEIKLFNHEIINLRKNIPGDKTSSKIEAPRDRITPGGYVLFVDNDIQVNAFIDEFGLIKQIAVSFEQGHAALLSGDLRLSFHPDYVYSPDNCLVSLHSVGSRNDNEIFNRLIFRLKARQISIDFHLNSLDNDMYSENHNQKKDTNYGKDPRYNTDTYLGVSFSKANRFAFPGGLIGESLRCLWDLSYKCPFSVNTGTIRGSSSDNSLPLIALHWKLWRLESDNLLFSNTAPGQSWEFCSVRGNIKTLPTNQFALGGQYDFYPNPHLISRSSYVAPYNDISVLNISKKNQGKSLLPFVIEMILPANPEDSEAILQSQAFQSLWYALQHSEFQKSFLLKDEDKSYQQSKSYIAIIKIVSPEQPLSFLHSHWYSSSAKKKSNLAYFSPLFFLLDEEIRMQRRVPVSFPSNIQLRCLSANQIRLHLSNIEHIDYNRLNEKDAVSFMDNVLDFPRYPSTKKISNKEVNETNSIQFASSFVSRVFMQWFKAQSNANLPTTNFIKKPLLRVTILAGFSFENMNFDFSKDYISNNMQLLWNELNTILENYLNRFSSDDSVQLTVYLSSALSRENLKDDTSGIFPESSSILWNDDFSQDQLRLPKYTAGNVLPKKISFITSRFDSFRLTSNCSDLMDHTMHKSKNGGNSTPTAKCSSNFFENRFRPLLYIQRMNEKILNYIERLQAMQKSDLLLILPSSPLPINVSIEAGLLGVPVVLHDSCKYYESTLKPNDPKHQNFDLNNGIFGSRDSFFFEEGAAVNLLNPISNILADHSILKEKSSNVFLAASKLSIEEQAKVHFYNWVSKVSL